MKRNTVGLSLVLSLHCVLGCSAQWDDQRLVERHLLLGQGLEVGSNLMLVDHNTSTALLLNVKHPQGTARALSLRTDPIATQQCNGDERSGLVLSRGRAGDSNAKEEPAALTVVSADGGTRVYRLGTAAFDRIHQSPDGSYVVLRRTTSGRQLVQNLNEVAVVAVDKTPDEESAVSFVTLERPPMHVVFSDKFSIDGQKRRLAAVLSSSLITLIDLDHLEWHPTLVDLSTAQGAEVAPMQVLFDAPSNRIFVRGDGASDVFVLRLLPRKQVASRSDFATAVDIVAAGRSPTDMALYDLDERRYLFVTLPSSNSAMMVDVATSRTSTILLPGPMDRVLTRNVATDVGTEPVALVWNDKGVQLATVRLDLVGQDSESAVLELPSTQYRIRRMLEPDPGGKLLCLLEGPGLAIVDPAAGTVAPYATETVLADALVDAQRRRLWVAPPGQDRAAYVDIRDGATSEIQLDARFAVPILMTRNGVLALVHDDPLGYVTFVDVEAPSRETAWSARGFLAGRILD
ncbi:MAG: hypothetical protein JW940_01720 [Polyangiaceae bacterium]|nr:hypothetical protein [Polyangiaceae bacterium]